MSNVDVTVSSYWKGFFAAVCGAFASNADKVLVNDSHGPFRNLLADRLDPRARCRASHAI